VANTGLPSDPGDGAAALGLLVTGFACFAIAGLSPWVVYRLLPSVEQAAVSSGIVGGWGRSAMTAVHAGLMVKSMGATAAASAATRPLPHAATAAAHTGAGAAGTAAGAGAAAGSPSAATGPVSSPSPRRPAVAPPGGGPPPSHGDRRSAEAPADVEEDQ
jgi:hypothetical protein